MHILFHRSRRLWASLLVTAAAAALTPGLIATSRAANILWGTATNISADSNVLSAGIAVGAFRLGQPGLTAATVNGVTFLPIGVADGTTTFTTGNFTLAFNGASYGSNTGFGSTAAPYSNLPAATQNLLQSGQFAQNNAITLTMSGLVVGTAYTFEWWSNNAGVYSSLAGQRTRATGGTGTVTLNNNSNATGTTGTTTTAGGVGQFAVGTFTADAASQTITFVSTNDFAEVNTFQLRTVPEPSTWALLGIGASVLGTGVLRHRKSRQR